MASEISFNKPMFSDLQFEFDESEDCWVRKPIFTDLQFEFDESEDCWVRSTRGTNDDKVAVVSETRWSTTVLPNGGGSSVVERAKSVPMKIPDWRRILGVAFQQDQRARQDSDYNAPWSVEEEDEDEYFGLPPHVYLARTRVASLSGRDLWRLRNAIWKRPGFED